MEVELYHWSDSENHMLATLEFPGRPEVGDQVQFGLPSENWEFAAKIIEVTFYFQDRDGPCDTRCCYTIQAVVKGITPEEDEVAKRHIKRIDAELEREVEAQVE